MRINVESVLPEAHRYETCGDYFLDKDGTIQVRVTCQKEWRYEFLIVLHELIEAFCCLHRGIRWESIDEFDKTFNAAQIPGEPGDSPIAPYRREHRFAENIERLVASEIGVDWATYDRDLKV